MVQPTSAEELAADGLLAIPGGVDAHTHLVHRGLGDRLGFPVWVDDFWSSSRAAIAGGITTIGTMTWLHPGPAIAVAGGEVRGPGINRWFRAGTGVSRTADRGTGQ